MKKLFWTAAACLGCLFLLAANSGPGIAQIGPYPMARPEVMSERPINRQEALEIKALGTKLRNELRALRIENQSLKKENGRLRWLARRQKVEHLLSDEKFWPADRFAQPLGVGDRAFLKDLNLKVVQILAADSMLVEISAGRDASAWLARMNKIKTAGLVDEQRISFAGAFEIVGTFQYVNALGVQKTVFVLEPIEEFPEPLE